MRTAASIRLRPWPSLRRYQNSSQRGVAALEFALLSPMLILMLMSMYDIANGWLTWRRMAAAAGSVGQIATMLAVNADGTNSLTYDLAWRASTAVYASMPQLLVPSARYGVILTEVQFSAPANCGKASCVASVAWSRALLGTGAAPRPCGVLTAVADSAPPGPAVLAQSAFQAAPVLVVDVTYAFKPLFLGGVVGAIQMARSAYYPARSGSLDQTIAYLDPFFQCPAYVPPKNKDD